MFSECFFKYLSKYVFKIQRSFLAIIIFFLIMSGLCTNDIYAKAAAATQAQIYADDVVIKAGDSVDIPVFIKNNPGMMGWLITVGYDSEKIEIKNVWAGNLSANGIFDYNTSPEHADSALILWSYTKEVTGDGILFYLNIKATENLGKDKTVIRLKCSEEDTFNEKYETVSPKCIPIEIRGAEKTVLIPSDETGAPQTESPEVGNYAESRHKSSSEAQTEGSTAAQSETATALQNESSTAVQNETSKAMQKDTVDMTQPEQSEKTEGVSDGRQNECTVAAGEYDADENMNGGEDASGDEIETTDGKTIVIDDVVKSREDDKKEEWFLIISAAAAGVVLVGLLGVVWWKLHKIKGKKS